MLPNSHDKTSRQPETRPKQVQILSYGPESPEVKTQPKLSASQLNNTPRRMTEQLYASQVSTPGMQPKANSPARSVGAPRSPNRNQKTQPSEQERAERAIKSTQQQIYQQSQFLAKLKQAVEKQEQQLREKRALLQQLTEELEAQKKINSQLQTKFLKEQARAVQSATAVGKDQKQTELNSRELDDKFVQLKSEYQIYQKQLTQQVKENVELKFKAEQSQRSTAQLKKDVEKLQKKLYQYKCDQRDGIFVDPTKGLNALIAEAEEEFLENQAFIILAEQQKL